MSKQAPDVVTAIEWAKRGQDCMTLCPAHEDNAASLHVSPGKEHPVIVQCHAGCETGAVLEAAHLTWAEVCNERAPQGGSTATEWTVYPYYDADGRLIFQTIRKPQSDGSKRFVQRHPVGDGWEYNLNGIATTIYRLPAVLRAVRDSQTVYVAEGEKDAEALVMDGLCGTCNPMGAGKWKDTYSEHLRGATVVIVADNDKPGREHAKAVSASLEAVGCVVTVVESDRGKDYYDHRSKGGRLEDFVVTHQTEQVREMRPAYTIDEMVDTDFDCGREIIPGHLAEANIVLLVGPEGHGKSLMMRQMAVQCAAGINPFTSANMEPLKVLYIDAENPEHQQKIDWTRLRWLAKRHHDGDEWGQNLSIIATWQDPPSLIHPNGQEWFLERITAFQPDICFLGPMTDLVRGKLAEDDTAMKFKEALYRGRTICKTAFVVEHHSPHRMAGDKTREMRPYGSSQLRRFPDFGYGIESQDDGEYRLTAFRGERVRSRAWPNVIRKGKPNSMEWPWEFGEDVSGSVVVGQFGNR